MVVNRAILARRAPSSLWEEDDTIVVIKPEACINCQASLAGDDPTPWRHQVREIPPIKPLVTEYQWHQWQCAACGEMTERHGQQECPVAPMARESRRWWRCLGSVSLVQTDDAADDA